MTDFNKPSADILSIVFNGPVVAGIGATVDPGLPKDKFHHIPWDVEKLTKVRIQESAGDSTRDLRLVGAPAGTKIKGKTVLKTAVHNVDNVFQFAETFQSLSAVPNAEKARFRIDLITIIVLMMTYNYYGGECVSVSRDAAAKYADPDSDLANEVYTMTSVNRAATFLLARMHTKYQTNHVLGGNPMQASMASAVRAFYNVSAATAREPGAKQKVQMYAKGLHWATHPANERLLIPLAIINTKIDTAFVHTEGPTVSYIQTDEYFAIRARTPPAATHHFYVAATAIRQLEPFGILSYLPSPARMDDVKTGYAMIHMHGAALHPAARFWGLNRISANQKLVEPLCADLGYAIKKLMPGSSLAASPILDREDSLNAAWRSFIDSLRSAMDQASESMLDSATFENIKRRIAPKEQDVSVIKEITSLLDGPTATGESATDTPDDNDGTDPSSASFRQDAPVTTDDSAGPAPEDDEAF